MSRESSSRLSRRALLAGLGLGLGAASAGALAAPALHLDWTRKPDAMGSRWNPRASSLSRAGMNEWKRQVGSEFALAGGAVAKLVEVTPLRSLGRRPDGLRGGAFTAVFESTGSALPPGDRMIDVSHAGAGAMKIYFSACGEKCGGLRLQAIFN